jgi:hypothetical protein
MIVIKWRDKTVASRLCLQTIRLKKQLLQKYFDKDIPPYPMYSNVKI